jgi:N-acetylmuramoyl-L-alanine amidase
MHIKIKILFIFFILFFIFVFPVAASEIQQIAFVVGQSSYQVNDQIKPMDAAIFIENSRTYVPVRYLGEALNARINWNQKTKTVTLLLNNSRVDLNIDRKIITINGQTNQMDVAPVLKNNRVYLPARPIAEAFSFKVKWEKESNKVVVLPLEKPAETKVLSETTNNSKESESEETTLELKINEENSITKATVTAFQQINYKIFKLTAPDRLIIDVQDIRPGNLPPAVIVNFEVVSQVRVGWFSNNPDVTRLVFDLNKRASYHSYLSEDKKSLTVEIFTPKPGEENLVVLDPGHGGSDPGAVGPNGLKEKDVNLDVAKRVKEILASQNIKTALTREGDNYVGLYERSGMANNLDASIFVSIHMNAHENRDANGTSVFYYCYYNEQKAEEIVRQEKSKELANIMQQNLLNFLGLKDRGVQQANFAVVRTTNMPAILVEAAFISNYTEENLLAQEYFRQKIAQAIAQGIIDFIITQKAQ